MRKLLFLLLLCAIPAWPQAGGYSSPAQGGGGTNFGASTVIVTGGAGGLSGTSGFGTTANRRYFVTANDTETAALSITAAFVTVECNPGVTIQQLTASTRLFNLGSGANNFTLRNCGVSPPASGTVGALIGDTAATPVNNIILDNVQLVANSSTGTLQASDFGFVYITGGSHHSLDVWSPAASDNVVTLDTADPSTHNTISDVTIATRHGNLVESANNVYGIVLRPNAKVGTGSITELNIDADVWSASGAFYGGWGYAGLGPSDSKIIVRAHLTATSTPAMFSGSCVAHCEITAIVDDEGQDAFGGGIVMNDSADFILNAYVHFTNGSSGIPFEALDSRNFTLNLEASGDLNVATGLPSNGWSTTQPCIFLQNQTTVAMTNITLGNIQCYMPPGSTVDGIDFQLQGVLSPIADGLVVTPGVHLVGVSGAGSTGINLTNTATGGAQSFVNSVIANPWIRNFVTGINIGAGVNQTQVNGALITGATTPVSNSGTNSRIWTHRVQTTGTLASGTLAVTFSGNDVWTGATTYQCNGSDQTAPTNAVSFTYTSGTAMTITGTTTDVIRYQCWGY